MGRTPPYQSDLAADPPESSADAPNESNLNLYRLLSFVNGLFLRPGVKSHQRLTTNYLRDRLVFQMKSAAVHPVAHAMLKVDFTQGLQ